MIFGTECVVMDEISFTFTASGKEASTSCRKNNVFCEIDQEAVSLVDSRLQLSEETYCKILSDCRREHDIPFDEIELNHETTPDSEKRRT